MKDDKWFGPMQASAGSTVQHTTGPFSTREINQQMLDDDSFEEYWMRQGPEKQRQRDSQEQKEERLRKLRSGWHDANMEATRISEAVRGQEQGFAPNPVRPPGLLKREFANLKHAWWQLFHPIAALTADIDDVRIENLDEATPEVRLEEESGTDQPSE